MTPKMSASAAMQAQLQSVPASVAPGGGLMPLLLRAAQTVGSAQQASVILGLLDQAMFAGVAQPPQSVSFPADHLYHLENTDEWYWLSANLVDEDENLFAFVISFEALRTVGQDVQRRAGWANEECHLMSTVATVAVAPPGGAGSALYRRSPNINWNILTPGSVGFPALDNFVIQAGPDSFRGSPDSVLPTTVVVDDEDGGMQVSLTFSAVDGVDPPWFLQGDGGITPAPAAGIYYSWPQCPVTGTITVGGATFTVSGTGWIDHQLMMNPVPPPSPIMPPPKPLRTSFFGWNWCQFNLDNGDAFTGSCSQESEIWSTRAPAFGFYVQRTEAGWRRIFCEGDPTWNFDDLVPVLDNALQPASFVYASKGDAPESPDSEPGLLTIELAAEPLHIDGSFYNPNLSVFSEVGAIVAGALVVSGEPRLLAGAGYCETNGFEVTASYRARALEFLGVGPLPG